MKVREDDFSCCSKGKSESHPSVAEAILEDLESTTRRYNNKKKQKTTSKTKPEQTGVKGKSKRLSKSIKKRKRGSYSTVLSGFDDPQSSVDVEQSPNKIYTLVGLAGPQKLVRSMKQETA